MFTSKKSISEYLKDNLRIKLVQADVSSDLLYKDKYISFFFILVLNIVANDRK